MQHGPVILFIVAISVLVYNDYSPVSGLVVPQTNQLSGPQQYPFCFMNITTDRAQECVIQVYAYAINNTRYVMQADNSSINWYKDLQAYPQLINPTTSFNLSSNFQSFVNQPEAAPNLAGASSDILVSNLGLVASSDIPVYVQGVKTDLGSTDAFAPFPVVQTSTEFFVGGWPYFGNVSGFVFLAQVQIIAGTDSTCLEIWKIFNGTQYVRVISGTIDRYQVFRYYADKEILSTSTYTTVMQGTNPEDITGYFINTTKPVQVIFGHECGWVPSPSVRYCDYMAEQIPPRNQLGVNYVVPPIIGRSPIAGYLVRVVATCPGVNTTVTYNNTSQQLAMGQFLQYIAPDCSKPTLITCSCDCEIMQYNMGNQQASINGGVETSNTDPCMQLIAPDNRFTAGAGFATANFCAANLTLIPFINYVSIVTFWAYKDNIQIDQQSIASQTGFTGWMQVTNGGVVYAVGAFYIQFGFHYVDMLPGTTGSFAVYSYGHSMIATSTSAYCVLVNYNITGVGLNTTWLAAEPAYNNWVASQNNQSCTSEAQLTGEIISSNYGQYADFPFTLVAQIQPPINLSPMCLSLYNDSVYNDLEQFTALINQWICQTLNCSYLGGVGVALNYDTLAVSWVPEGGPYSALQVYVDMIASYSTTAANFAQCRLDIMNYMESFLNWPEMLSTLVSNPGNGCPYPLPFVQPAFAVGSMTCPAF